MPFPRTASALTALAFIALSTGSAGAFGAGAIPTFKPASMPAQDVEDGRIVLAQAGDPRIVQLQEQIRDLTGRVEELNFQLMQMQEQMRRMQEDNEFRFQQLEQGSGTTDSQDSAATDRSGQAASANGAASTEKSARAGSDTESGGSGEPPRVLGNITFDENGNVVSSGTGGEPVDLLGSGSETDGSTVAALPESNDPDAVYRNAYEFILSGDYDTAEAGFRQYLEQFPEGAHAADANFWLGESLLAQERHREAAEVFLEANRAYPSASKAPDMLLKLGVSLAAMGQQEVACATFDEMKQRYPEISGALSDRVRTEEASAGC